MNVKILSVFAVLLLLVLMVPTALAYDANNPARFIVNFAVRSDSAFLVNINSGEERITFVVAAAPANDVPPKGINPPDPWATIENIGNGLTETYTVDLDAPNDPLVSLEVAPNPGFLPSAPLNVPGPVGFNPQWTGIPVNGIVEVHLRADFLAGAGAGYSSSNRLNVYSANP